MAEVKEWIDRYNEIRLRVVSWGGQAHGFLKGHGSKASLEIAAKLDEALHDLIELGEPEAHSPAPDTPQREYIDPVVAFEREHFPTAFTKDGQVPVASATQGTRGEEIVSGGATGAIGAESAGASAVQTGDISTGPSLRNEPLTIDQLEEAHKFLENWDKFEWQDGYTLERCLEAYASSLRSKVERLKAERDALLAQRDEAVSDVERLDRTVSELRARIATASKATT